MLRIDYKGKYKTQKDSYLASVFVGKIKVKKHDNHKTMKGTVTRSFAIEDSPYKVWVAFQGNTLSGACCTGIAGTAQICNHIIALVYKVKYAIFMEYNDPACTSTSCNLNKSSQTPITPMKVSEMNLRQDNRLANEKKGNLNPQTKKRL